jgi:hypothetical protein
MNLKVLGCDILNGTTQGWVLPTSHFANDITNIVLGNPNLLQPQIDG